MKVEQKCSKCGEVFMRSLYHPQIVECPDCKSGKKGKNCIWCKYSYKKEWSLWCFKLNKDVTGGLNCESFIPQKFTQEQKKEIEEILKMTGGRS